MAVYEGVLTILMCIKIYNMHTLKLSRKNGSSFFFFFTCVLLISYDIIDMHVMLVCDMIKVPFNRKAKIQ